MCATYSAHLLLLDLLIIILFDEEINYEAPYYVVSTNPSSNFSPNILHRTLFSTSVYFLSLISKAKFHMHTDSQAKL
jgi:hypothetical protein